MRVSGSIGGDVEDVLDEFSIDEARGNVVRQHTVNDVAPEERMSFIQSILSLEIVDGHGTEIFAPVCKCQCGGECDGLYEAGDGFSSISVEFIALA